MLQSTRFFFFNSTEEKIHSLLDWQGTGSRNQFKMQGLKGIFKMEYTDKAKRKKKEKKEKHIN